MVKGYIYTIEAILVAILILSGIMIFYPTQTSPELLQDRCYKCLKDLDNQGILRIYIIRNKINELEDIMKNCVGSEVAIAACKDVNCSPEKELPVNKAITIVSYLIAGGGTRAEPMLVKVYAW